MFLEKLKNTIDCFLGSFSHNKYLSSEEIEKLVKKKQKKDFTIAGRLYKSFDELDKKWSHPNWTDAFNHIIENITKNLKNNINYYANRNKDNSKKLKEGRYEWIPLPDSIYNMRVFFVPENEKFNVYSITIKKRKY